MLVNYGLKASLSSTETCSEELNEASVVMIKLTTTGIQPQSQLNEGNITCPAKLVSEL